MLGAFESARASVAEQWQSSARLRIATLLAIALLWTWLLLAWSDHIDARSAQAADLRATIERNKPLGRGQAWPARAEEAAKQLAVVRGLLWQESDVGVAEAALQDALRQLAARTGVTPRELVVTRVVDRARAAGDTSAPTPDGKTSYLELRARMVFDFRRDRLTALLSELGHLPQLVVVDRLVFHTASLPPTAEVEVRVVVDTARRGGA